MLRATTQGLMNVRPVILGTVVVCLAMAMAPWLTGGQEPLGLLLSGFSLALGALLIWRQPTARVLRRGPLVVSFGLLIALGMASWLWTANTYSTGLWVVQWLGAGLAFRLSYAISSEAKGRQWVIRAYLVSVVLFCGAAVWMYFTSNYGRLTGTFYWANPAAAYLLPAIILAVDGIRRVVGRAQYYWVGLTTLFLTCFFLADSRATTAVLLVIIILYLLLVKLNKRFWILFLFSLVLAFGMSTGAARLAAISSENNTKLTPGSRFAEALKGDAMSGSDRAYYLDSALRMWYAHPLGGVGAGAFGDVQPQYQKRVVSATTSAHNAYVQTLAELGLGGALLLASVLLCLLLGSLRGLVSRPELVPLGVGTLGVLLHVGVDIDAKYPAILCLVGIFFGLMYAQNNFKWVKTSWVWPAIALLVLIPVVSLYLSGTRFQHGKTAQANGDYELAREKFALAASGVVYNPDAYTARGINAYTLGLSTDQGSEEYRGRMQEALEQARLAQAHDLHDGQHFQLAGRVLAQQGRLAEAETAFRQALARDRLNHPDYMLDLAQVLVRQGRAKEALQEAQSMLGLYPQWVVDNRVADESLRPVLADLEALCGNIWLSQGQIEPARAAAMRALKLHKENLRGRALENQLRKLEPAAPSQ